MFMKSMVSLFAAMLVATSVQAGPLDVLSETLVGFECELNDQKEFILFGEIDGQLSMLSPSYLSSRDESVPVDKTEVGYRFTVEDDILMFLSHLGEEGWMLFYSTENGPWSAECIEIRDLPLNVASALQDSFNLFYKEAMESFSVKLAEALRQNELLTQQVVVLRKQLNSLQSLLDDSVARDASRAEEMRSLGSELNVALARIAVQKRQLESDEMAQYRTLFQGLIRDELGDEKWVRIVGDRLIIPTDTVFSPGSTELSDEGKVELGKVAGVLQRLIEGVPEGRDYFIRVDGHTDDVPLSGLGEVAGNWELSQSRALAVVKFLSEVHGIAPHRLSANGFGEFKPLAQEGSEQARSQNRRIELVWSDR